MSPDTDAAVKDKHLLIAVDESDSSRRAVLYVADFLGGFPGFTVTLISIIPEPEEDFFESDAAMNTWIKDKVDATNKMLANYKQVLMQSGFPEEKVRFRSCVGEAKSFSDAILETRCDLTCCTVVVGRHHKTKTEEFLFGSTSNRLIHEAKNCAVWVVE
ncbi:MAG TPA: universal stress protein [Nitrospirota bacterium]|nr:universal stress protein [Nitrospirota bacterium]